jgi:hypothetical protein
VVKIAIYLGYISIIFERKNMTEVQYLEQRRIEILIIENINSDLLQVKGSGIQYLPSLGIFVLHHPEMQWVWGKLFDEVCELFDEDDEPFAVETFVRTGNFAILKLTQKPEKTS